MILQLVIVDVLQHLAHLAQHIIALLAIAILLLALLAKFVIQQLVIVDVLQHLAHLAQHGIALLAIAILLFALHVKIVLLVVVSQEYVQKVLFVMLVRMHVYTHLAQLVYHATHLIAIIVSVVLTNASPEMFAEVVFVSLLLLLNVLRVNSSARIQVHANQLVLLALRVK